jgi:hypothetical protein
MLSYSFNVEVRGLKSRMKAHREVIKEPVWPKRLEVISQENAAFIQQYPLPPLA